jgi:hypothetical protein
LTASDSLFTFLVVETRRYNAARKAGNASAHQKYLILLR